jgi:hypothetical protein
MNFTYEKKIHQEIMVILIFSIEVFSFYISPPCDFCHGTNYVIGTYPCRLPKKIITTNLQPGFIPNSSRILFQVPS